MGTTVLDALDYLRRCLEGEAEGELLPDDALTVLADVTSWATTATQFVNAELPATAWPY